MFLNIQEVVCFIADNVFFFFFFNIINTFLLFSLTSAIMEPALLVAYLVQKSTNVAMHVN